MDTGTVRLVIFLGMFLVFVSDYSSLISTIFGNNAERNSTFKLINGQPKAESSSEKLFKDELKINFEKRNVISRRSKLMTTIKTACLPKLICELKSHVHQEQLTEMETTLLNLIRDTSLNTMAEVPSRYHFAAHMGQLIAGLEGQGCHNFYPTCPLPGLSVLNMMKKIRIL